MAEIKWSEEQKQAIEQKGSNILVAAAAGSGKTAVLVERMINKVINENVDIDKILVVTFTKAAAGEMRERILEAIYKKLDKDPDNENLQRQLLLINNASICTIDSFCQNIIKNNFFEIDTSANFRIAEDSEVMLLQDETMEEIFEENYLDKNEDFFKLIDSYTTYRDDEPLKEMLLRIYKYIQSNPNPERWLEEAVEKFNLKDKLDEDFSKTIWGKILLQEVYDETYDATLKLKQIKKYVDSYAEAGKFSIVLGEDINQIDTLLNHLDNWDDAYNIASTISFTRFPTDKNVSIELKDKIKEVRKEVKDKCIKDKVNKILIMNSKEVNSDINAMYPNLLAIKRLILEFTKRFAQKKKEKNIIDFNDMEHFALQILSKQIEENVDDLNEDNNEKESSVIKHSVAEKYQHKYNEVAIDEYQDSNLVQEILLTSVSKGNNIFMVGDVKQSIYKFRQACPELFLKKYEEYKLLQEKTENDNLKIQLFKNFRSRKNILDITNLVFKNIMSKELGDIDYTEEEYLNLGASYPEPESHITNYAGIAQMYVLEEKKQDDEIMLGQDELEEESNEELDTQDLDKIQIEAKFVAKKIQELLNSDYNVYDKKKETYRHVTYKDIVILMRAISKPAPIFEKELVELGIPVFSDSSDNYLETIEIQTIMSVLRIIDNPMQDVPLVAVLRSWIGNFTDNDLVEIRIYDKYTSFYDALKKAKEECTGKLKEKIDRFLNMLSTWRQAQDYLALDELIWKIYMDTGYYNYVSLMKNGNLKQANLKMLFDKAKKYEQSSYKGLYNFITYIDKIMEKGSSKDNGVAKLIGESDNVVRIMSIHKSKGLEFPVVFLSCSGKQINNMDLKDKLQLHQTLGIGPRYIDSEMKIEYDTLAKLALALKTKQELISEEMRILYVALTRPKEKLFITGMQKDSIKTMNKLESKIQMYGKSQNGKIAKKLVEDCDSYLKWFELVYLYNKENIKDILQVYTYTKEETLKYINDIETTDDIDVLEKLNNIQVNKDNVEKIKNILEQKYYKDFAVTLPTKTSVSRIKQLDQEEQFENNKNKNHDIKKDKKTLLDVLVVKNEEEDIKENEQSSQILTMVPKFMQKEETKISAARRGTLMHLCMEKLDVNKIYSSEDIHSFVDDLVRKNIITEKEKSGINENILYKYTKSEFFNNLKQAKEIYKEQPFYIKVQAKEVYKDITEEQENQIADEEILVQGIIDLYYIDKDDKIVLVDYKTDYVEKGNEIVLIEKYKKQLELYRNAIQKSLNKKVDKVMIYSLYTLNTVEAEDLE